MKEDSFDSVLFDQWERQDSVWKSDSHFDVASTGYSYALLSLSTYPGNQTIGHDTLDFQHQLLSLLSSKNYTLFQESIYVKHRKIYLPQKCWLSSRSRIYGITYSFRKRSILIGRPITIMFWCMGLIWFNLRLWKRRTIGIPIDSFDTIFRKKR